MKNAPSVIAAIILALIFGLYMCTYQVRFTEVAIIKTFGRADPNVIEEPGLRFKLPPPIQAVVKYDKRIRLLEDTPEETPTRDSNNLIVSTFTAWTISDPALFNSSHKLESDAEESFRAKIRAHKKSVVGKHTFAEFVSTDPAQRKLAEIEGEMEQLVSAEAAKSGMKVHFFGIKQLALPKEVTNTVFETMKKTEQNKADNFKAQGEAEAKKIVAEAEQSANRIMAVAEARADDIRSAGRAEVSRLAKKFEEAPELRVFLDYLDSFGEILRSRATIILDTYYPPISLLELDKGLTQGASPDQARQVLSDVIQRNPGEMNEIDVSPEPASKGSN